MSERLYKEEEWPFEQELIGFNGETLGELEEHLITFELSTEKFINTFTSAMEGTAGQHFFDAITLSHAARVAHVTELEEISEYICDSMDQNTAVRVWATVVRDSMTNILGGMVAINEKAGFHVPDMKDLQSKGLVYFEGLMKALEDGEDMYRVSEGIQENGEEAKFDAVAVEDLPELIENEFDDDGIEDLEQIRDEYGQWVVAEYCNNLGEYLDDLLELCPEDTYPPSTSG